jgi:mRNA-degrading endonuclease RelE of RelBE toxin-antitoxin system
MLALDFLPAARKDMKRLESKTAARVLNKLQELSRMHPDWRGFDVSKLSNQHEYRLRVGDYRALFVIENGHLTVRAVGHRREIYQ